jgi:O-antigen/teichoic acid export membrane protein
VDDLEIENSNKPSDSSITEEAAGFRSVFKNTTIFGGVQVFNIIISLIRGKVLAILIGTAGMGLNGLLMSSLTVINRVSGLGLSESAVRDISEANNSNDRIVLQRVYTVFKHWIWLTGILGLILTISLSPLLSRLAFGNGSYTISFIILSVTFIFGALTGGIYTLLRGMRKIRDLARANIAGSIAGLLVTIPIFYFYGMKGVIPAIIATSVATYLVSIYFRYKVDIKTTEISLRETFQEGKQMATLGITLSISSLLSTGVTFLLNSYISNTGSLEDLGIFNAGQSIMSGYVGMVFTAMGVDYYPRLSGVIDKLKEWTTVVNQQVEIVLLILGPILSFILLSAPILIKILLSSEFLPALGFIVWASVAILLKGIVWVSGFVLIAKGEKKIYLYVQLAGALWFLPLNILFYNLLGITGLGISMLIDYSISTLVFYFVLIKYFKFRLSKAAYRLSAIFMLLLGISVSFIKILEFPRAYYFCGAIFIVSAIISLKGLNTRMDLMKVVEKFRNKKK